jgi:hypothetical protein
MAHRHAQASSRGYTGMIVAAAPRCRGARALHGRLVMSSPPLPVDRESFFSLVPDICAPGEGELRLWTSRGSRSSVPGSLHT